MLLLIFRLDKTHYALPIAGVVRVVRAVAMLALPGSPPEVMGVIDVEGDLVPVFSIRRRFGVDEHPLHPRHQMIIVRTAARQLALLVDEVGNVVERDDAEIASIAAARTQAPFQGAARIEGELVLIHDVELLLSPVEGVVLDAALEALS